MSETPDRPENHWTLDKRIPVAVIGTVLVAIGTAFVAHYRLATLEQRVERHEGRTENRFGTIEAAARQQERDLAVRDGAIREALTELRVTNNTLRETMAELRVAIRALEGARGGVTYPAETRTTPSTR